MKLIVINNSSDVYNFLSNTVTVAAEASTEISSLYWFSLFTDDAFMQNIRNGNLRLSDGTRAYTSISECEDFLRTANIDVNYNNKDTDGAQIMRIKAAKKGWSFWAIPVEITTSTIRGSQFCQTSDGVDIPWVTTKIYNDLNNEITTPGLLDINLGTCVKTVIDFEPTFDYEIVGGTLRVNSNPSADIRLWIVGAPDIPAAAGGSKEFASGINLKFLAPDASFEIDGRVTKFLTYNSTLHTGKMRIILKHPAGTQINTQVIMHIYRQ
jgi:hypothetical protein